MPADAVSTSSRRNRPASSGRRPRLGAVQVTALVALLAVVVAAATVATLVWRADQADRERGWAQRAATGLQHEVLEGSVAVLGVRGLLYAGGDVSEEEFARYSAPRSAALGSSGSPGYRACPPPRARPSSAGAA